MKILLTILFIGLSVNGQALEWQRINQVGVPLDLEAVGLDKKPQSNFPKTGEIFSIRLMANGAGAMSLPPTLKFDSYKTQFKKWINSRGFIDKMSGAGGFYESFQGQAFETTRDIFYRCGHQELAKGVEMADYLIEFKSQKNILIELLENGELIACGLGSLVIPGDQIDQDLDYFVLRCSSPLGEVNPGLLWIHGYNSYEEVYAEQAIKLTPENRSDLEWQPVTSRLWTELTSINIPMWYRRVYECDSSESDYVRLRAAHSIKKIMINGIEFDSGSLLPTSLFQKGDNEILLLRHGLYLGMNQDFEFEPIRTFLYQTKLVKPADFMILASRDKSLAVWSGESFVGMLGGALSYPSLDLRGFDLDKNPLRLMSLSGELTAQDLASLQFHSEKQNWRRLKWENESAKPHFFRGSAYEEYSPVSDGVTLSDRALDGCLKGSFYLTSEDLSENNKYLVFRVPGGIADALWRTDELWIPRAVKINGVDYVVAEQGLDLSLVKLRKGWNEVEIQVNGKFVEPVICIGKKLAGEFHQQPAVSYDVLVNGLSLERAYVKETDGVAQIKVELIIPAGREAELYLNGAKFLEQKNASHELKTFVLDKEVKLSKDSALHFAMGQSQRSLNVLKKAPQKTPLIDLSAIELSASEFQVLVGERSETLAATLGEFNRVDSLNFGNLANPDKSIPGIYDILADGNAVYKSLYGRIRSKLLRESKGGQRCQFICPTPPPIDGPMKAIEFSAFMRWRAFMDKELTGEYETQKEALEVYKDDVKEFRESRYTYVDLMIRSLVEELIFVAEEVKALP